MNFQDHNIFSNNLYDNLFYLRKKQLKENIGGTLTGLRTNPQRPVQGPTTKNSMLPSDPSPVSGNFGLQGQGGGIIGPNASGSNKPDLSRGFTDPDTGKQIGGQQFKPMEYEFGGGMGLPSKIKGDSSYFNQLSSTIQSGSGQNQGMNYRPGFTNAPTNQQQEPTTDQKNAEIAERNRKRSGIQADQMLTKGMQLAQQSGINPMGQINSSGGLSPNTIPLQNKNVGYTNQANISGFRASRGFV